MKKMVSILIIILSLSFVTTSIAGTCKLGPSGVVPSEYENTVVIVNDGKRKVYHNVKIIQYSKNYWVEFETMSGDVYKFNTGETQSIAIKHKKRNSTL